ncbi:ferredoxin [Pseudomonadota bacterium]
MSDQNNQPPADGNQQPPADQGGGEDKVVRIGDYNVQVVRKDCIGAATCVAVSPNVFEMDGENIAVIKEGASDTPENIVAAAQGCPTKAIVVKDANTGEQVWPK